MFFFLHGPGGKKGIAAVFFGFWDGSNTHAGAGIWSLCGFLGEKPAFDELDAAWTSVLNNPKWPKRPKRFHTVECVHGYGEFEGWSFAERLAIWGDMISVLATSKSVIGVSSVVITEDYAKLTDEERALLKSEALGEPLDLSVRYAIERSITLTRNTSEDETIGLLFDNENPAVRDRCYFFSNLYRGEFGFGKWLAGIGFGESVRFTPLQAADLLAYGMYRVVDEGRKPPETQSDFPIEPGFRRLAEGIYKAGGGFDLDSMKNLASQIRERHAKRHQ